MANAIANATAHAMAAAVADHGTVAGRPKATGYLLSGSLLHVFFMTCCYLLETFWHLLDALGDLFWTLGRLLADFGPGVQKGAKKLQNGRTLVAPGVPILRQFW